MDGMAGTANISGITLIKFGPLESSSKVPGFKCFKNLWFQRLLHPVATNARWHRKWSTDIAELTEQHFVGNTCGARLPNPNAGKVTRQKISSIPPQSNLPLVSSWVLFATTKACARFKKSESFLKGIFRSTRFSVVHGFKLTWLFSCCQEIHAHVAVQDNSKTNPGGIGVVAVVDCLRKYLKFPCEIHRGWWYVETSSRSPVTDIPGCPCSPWRARDLYRLCSFCRFYHYSYIPEVPNKKKPKKCLYQKRLPKKGGKLSFPGRVEKIKLKGCRRQVETVEKPRCFHRWYPASQSTKCFDVATASSQAVWLWVEDHPKKKEKNITCELRKHHA